MSGQGQDEGYLPSTLLSPDGAQGSGTFPRSTPLILSRRARQIQADEGILPPAQMGRVQIPDNRDVGALIAFDSARASRGRARAGTLPSSWGNLSTTPSLTTVPISTAAEASSTNLNSHSGLLSSLPPYPQSRHALHQPVAFTDSSLFVDGPQTSNRIRPISLSLADDGFANAFGPSIFSSWHPSRSGLSSLAMAADNTASAEHDSHLDGPDDEYASRDTFDESSTLDYLGLADGHPRRQEAAAGSANLRNRASTLASSVTRPRIGEMGGRARSSTFLPGFNFEHVSERDEQIDSSEAGLPTTQASCPPSAPRGRLGGQYGGNSLSAGFAPAHGLSAGDGARPRATSMGGLDGPVSPTSKLSTLTPSTLSFGIDEEAIRSYAIEQNIDPNAFVTFAQNKALRASFSSGPAPQPMASLAGRHRAGTVVALSGPGGCQRTEQELTRMSLSPNASQNRNVRPLGLSSYLDASVAVDSVPAPGQRHGNATATSPIPPGTPSNGQVGHPPSRCLYIGQLSSSATGQELMQAFAPYGAIDTLRLLPEKECGFINFVDMQDAIGAKDDIMTRLGGKIGLKTTSADGAIRIGFGKVDAIPQGSQQTLAANAGGAMSRGVPSPRLDHPAGDGLFGPPAESGNEQSTRALWIGSIPAATQLTALLDIFTPFGPVESVRVLASKNCGFINFERVDDAVRARKALHGRDVLGAKVGGVRIGFAKAPSKGQDGNGYPGEASSPDFHAAVEALANLQGGSAVPVEKQLANGNIEDYRSNLVLDLLEKQRTLQAGSPAPGPVTVLAQAPVTANATATAQASLHKSASNPIVGRFGSFPTHSSSNSIVPSSDKGGVPLPAEMKPQPTITDWQLIIRHLDEHDPEVSEHVESVSKCRELATYYSKIPPVAENSNSRKFDTTKLRELRKSIEANSCTQGDIDQIARDHLPDIVDLSSDFIGNTLVQKFFDKCSDALKVSMLESIAPHLAKIGVHKNGTWAAQKIIDCATTDEQRAIIAVHLRPFVPPLLTDQYGNYVVQKVIPFGSPHADFIFDAMIDRCWEVAQGRFGARSMRAVLESSQASKLQRKRVAAAIVLHSVPLATSQNGALLVTWLLDSASLPGRFRLLVPRFTPHLVHLCTHKLASLTLLRIITQSVDPEASRQVLLALLDPSQPQILEDVVTHQLHGSQFVFRLLTSNALDVQMQSICAGRVSELLIQHRLLDAPPYRPLVENLGLAAAPPPPPPVAGKFAPTGALPSAMSPISYGAMPPLPRSNSQLTADGGAAAGAGALYQPDGMRELNQAMAQALLQGSFHHQPQLGSRGSRTASQGAKPTRPPLYTGMTDCGVADFVERNGGTDGRRSQSFQSNAVLRSPTSDAFNPWAQASSVGSPESGPIPAPHRMAAHGNGGDAHSFYSDGGGGGGDSGNGNDASSSVKAGNAHRQQGDRLVSGPATYGHLLDRSTSAYAAYPVYQHHHHHHQAYDAARPY